MLILREILLGTISSLFTWRNGEQKGKENLCQFVVVQVLSHAWLFATPGTTACQASVPFTVSWSLLMSIDLVMPSNHLILCHPLLLQGKAFFVLCCAMLSCSVMSDSFCPCGLYPTRLLCPWDFPGKNPGVGCHFILQGSSCICLLFFPSSKIRKIIHFPSVQFSSVAQSCPTLCESMNRSTPGLPVHHQLLEFTQTHVHCVGDAIQPSHLLLSPSPPTFNLSQYQGLFQWAGSSPQVAKVPELQH